VIIGYYFYLLVKLINNMMVVVFFYFGLDEFFLLFFFFYPLNIVLERGFVEVKNRHLSLNKLFISVSLKRDYRY
jgi:hypothetical protein